MIIIVKVKASAKEDRVEDLGGNNFSIRVKAKPLEGRANEAVVSVLAEYFDVSRSRVVLIKGQTSRQKVFEIRR